LAPRPSFPKPCPTLRQVGLLAPGYSKPLHDSALAALFPLTKDRTYNAAFAATDGTVAAHLVALLSAPTSDVLMRGSATGLLCNLTLNCSRSFGREVSSD
jgi:hypothetical protein